MFEFIGIAVVCWFAFTIARGIYRAKRGSASKEYGLETRRIATQDLEVPDTFYNFITVNHMQQVKEAALMLKEKPGCERTSWPRLMAVCIYAFFYLDCKEYADGNPQKKELFERLNINPVLPFKIALQDPDEIRRKHC